MLVVLRSGALPVDRTEVANLLQCACHGAAPHAVRTALGEVYCAADENISPALSRQLAALTAVARVVSVPVPYQLASRVTHPHKTQVVVGDTVIGGDEPVIIAGPCAVESEEQIIAAAKAARTAGAHILRGGAFKPRTSPYSFQGLGHAGLALLAQARTSVGLPIVTEVMEPALVPAVAEVADMLQIGSRNMQNFPLLRAVARSGKPVLLKRGFAATIEEWLLAAEYVLAEDNSQVVLCERGVRGFDSQTRNVLDLACVPLLARLTHLPIVVDPSHATGRSELVPPMGLAAIAAGADGLLVEMHPDPARALCDAAQAISPDALRQLVCQSSAVHTALAASGNALGQGQSVGAGTRPPRPKHD